MEHSGGEQNKSLPQDFPTVWDSVVHSLHLSTAMPIIPSLHSSMWLPLACLDPKSNRSDLAFDSDASWNFWGSACSSGRKQAGLKTEDRAGAEMKAASQLMH